MFTNYIPKKDLRRLTDAITTAILNSKEAKLVLAEMYKKNFINSSMVMFLALNIQNIDCIKIGENKKSISQYIVDGRRLTKNERAFQEYCDAKFDEKEWLEKIGIKDYLTD